MMTIHRSVLRYMKFSAMNVSVYIRIYTSHVWQHVSRVIRVLSSISRISFIIAFSHMIFILLMGRNPAPVGMANLPFLHRVSYIPRWLTRAGFLNHQRLYVPLMFSAFYFIPPFSDWISKMWCGGTPGRQHIHHTPGISMVLSKWIISPPDNYRLFSSPK